MAIRPILSNKKIGPEIKKELVRWLVDHPEILKSHKFDYGRILYKTLVMAKEIFKEEDWPTIAAEIISANPFLAIEEVLGKTEGQWKRGRGEADLAPRDFIRVPRNTYKPLLMSEDKEVRLLAIDWMKQVEEQRKKEEALATSLPNKIEGATQSLLGPKAASGVEVRKVAAKRATR